MHVAETLRFRRRHLPHWEVNSASYFVTVRCADSLPRDALLRLRELQSSLAAIEPHSPAFAAEQRKLFVTLEKHLDSGHGACPLRDSAAAQIVTAEFAALADWQIAVPHFSIMPNHWHALLVPAPTVDAAHSLSAIMKRLKGRTGKRLRSILGGSGPFWQREWFDRWVRSDAERERIIVYIRNNPVKAGLAKSWQEHPCTQ